MHPAAIHQPADGRDQAARLKILAVAPWVPWPPVTYSHQVVSARLQALAERHDVLFVCGVHSDADAAALKGLAAITGVTTCGVRAGNTVGAAARAVHKVDTLVRGGLAGLPHKVYQTRHRALVAQVRELLSLRTPDLVYVDYWYMGLGWVDRCEAPTICYVHDLMAQRLRRAADVAGRRADDRLYSRNLAEVESRTLAAFTALATISSQDAATLQRTLPGCSVTALPAGVDTSTLAEYVATPGEPKTVAFVGALGAGPNEDAAWAFAHYVWPLIRRRYPEARFFIVGRGPSQRLLALDGRGGVTVTGEVDDVRLWYARAAAVVAPLRWGSGVKGKTLEALACGRPLVATSVAAEGIDITPGEHYLAAETPPELAAAVSRVFDDPELAARLGVVGRERVASLYDRTACLERIVAHADSVAAQGRA